MSVKQSAQRYRFAPEILAEVRRVSRSDNWHGPLEIIEHWGWIAFWCWASLTAWRHAPIGVAAAVYLAAVFFIGGRQRALAGVLHMATHRAFMRSTRVGSVLGAIFGGYPVLQSFTGYRASHLGQHHGRLGDPVLDPDYQQYQRYGLCGDDFGRASLRRYLRSIVTPRSTVSYILYLLRHRIVTAGERTGERWVRFILLGACVVAAIATGTWPIVVLLWLVPLVTTQVWLGSLAELLEHFPLIETASPREDIRMTWNRVTGVALRFLVGEKEGEGYHLVHHLFPRAPMWQLKRLDAVLRRDPVYAELPRLSGFATALTQIYELLPEDESKPALAA